MANNNYMGGKKLNSYPPNKNNPNQNLSPNYSSLNGLAEGLEDTEAQVGSLLSTINAGGPIGEDVYNLPNMNPAGGELNEDILKSTLQAIDNDIGETKNLMDRIMDQVNQNIETINQNNETINQNEAQIAANEATIGSLEASMPSGDDPEAAEARAQIEQEIANLRQQNETLKAQIEALEEMNSSLRADNAKLEEAYHEYKKLKEKKEDIQARLQNIANYLDGEFRSDMADRFDEDASMKELLANMTAEEIAAMVDNCDKDLKDLQNALKDTKKELDGLKSDAKDSTIDTLIRYHEEGKITDEQYEKLKAEKIELIGEESFKNHEDRVAKIIKLEQQYSSISQAISTKENVRDGLLMVEYSKYTQNADFTELSKSKVAKCDIDYGTGGDQEKKYTFYDADGNVIENPTDLEIAMFFNTEEGKKYADEIGMTTSVQKYYDAFKYLGEDKIAVLNYLSNTGDADKFNECSDFMTNLAEEIHGNEMYEDIKAQIEAIYAKIGVAKVSTSGFLASEREYTEDDALKETLELLAANGFKDGIQNFVAGFDNIFNGDGKRSAKEYKTMSLLKYLGDKYAGDEEKTSTLVAEIAKGTYNISSSLGNMAPSVLLGMLTGMPALGSIALGMSSGGNSYEEGLQSGLDTFQAGLYGMLSGASEATLQYFLGGIDPLGKGELANAIQAYTGLNKFFSGITSEVVEEELQALLGPALLRIATDGEYSTDDPTGKELLETAIYTAISTAIFNGTTMAIGGINYTFSKDALSGMTDIDFNSPTLAEDLINAGYLVEPGDTRAIINTNNEIELDSMQKIIFDRTGFDWYAMQLQQEGFTTNEIAQKMLETMMSMERDGTRRALENYVFEYLAASDPYGGAMAKANAAVTYRKLMQNITNQRGYEMLETRDGINYIAVKDMNTKLQPITVDDIDAIMSKLPHGIKQTIPNVVFYDIPSYNDKVNQMIGNYGDGQNASEYFRSGAEHDIRNGNIYVWSGNNVNEVAYIINHEAGHAMDKNFVHSNSAAYQNAVQADKALTGSTSPTAYGNTNLQEDFAESFFLYQAGKLDAYPNRKAYIESAIKYYQ